MNIIRAKQIGISTLAAFIILASVSLAAAQAGTQVRPELPVGCEHIDAPADQQVAFKVYATGVQVYWWNGTTWGFVGPLATLYADANYMGKVGLHYAGPTWKSNSGSLVIGKNPVRCTPDPDSIPWLGLEVDETDGAGIFSDVTYIQRVNTSGGKAPSTPGTFDGEEARIPYTTEYVFYRSNN